MHPSCDHAKPWARITRRFAMLCRVKLSGNHALLCPADLLGGQHLPTRAVPPTRSLARHLLVSLAVPALQAETQMSKPSTAAATGAAASAFLPTSVAWLENATLEVSTTQRRKGDVRYVLTVHHRPSHTKWSLSRSYDEYRQFQQRLLAALRSGHFCHAECPWLFTFVTSYFPKARLFRSSSARVIQFRREALQQYVGTIQSVLLNRANHGCAVLLDGAAAEFAELLCGSPTGLDALPLKQWAFAQRRSGSRGVGSRDSLDSRASTSDEESSGKSGSFDDAFCGVCDGSIERYRTTLRCGYHADQLTTISSISASGTSNSRPSIGSQQQPPATIRYLEQLSFSMISDHDSLKTKDVRYVLFVTHNRNALPWTVNRSFKDYRTLQTRLLAALQQGHFCNAECPWMYSFVKSQFPKDCRVLSSSKYVVRKRVEALSTCLSTLHSHVLNRLNHCCSVMTRAVAMELIEFLNADLNEGSDASWSHFAKRFESSSSSPVLDELSELSLHKVDISIRLAATLSSTTATSSPRCVSSLSNSNDCCCVCSLCSPSNNERLSEGDDGGWASPLEVVTSSSPLVTLSCGHRFHDECIVPRLNEALQCPTCGRAQAFY
ncbi:hypothetical protein PybrP1_011969 [[Pythium] brassicae (nom. inval.)]|nr:hypothetical protein PybrP1_011969 [[Pythium] brassicae (nom. inval.)]